ncbi:hypothetical protein D910_02268, partial [Dendroctonus ponderosae]
HKRKDIIAKNLQAAIDLICDWFILWKIKINSDKSHAIFLGRKLDTCTKRITIDDKEVAWTSSCGQGKNGIAQLYSLLNKKSQLSLKNRLTLIKAIIRPAVLYASTAWGHAADTSIHRIQAMENKLLRMALDAPWFIRNAQIYRDLEWKPFRQALKEKAEATYRRTEEHPRGTQKAR